PRPLHQSVNVSGSMSARIAILPQPLISSHCLPTRTFQSSYVAGIFPESVKIASALRYVSSSLNQAIPMTPFILTPPFVYRRTVRSIGCFVRYILIRRDGLYALKAAIFLFFIIRETPQDYNTIVNLSVRKRPMKC